MKCQNCGANEANVKYTQIINGVKKEMILCQDCSQELGIGDIGFNMPIDFSSFLSEFFNTEDSGMLSDLMLPKELKCDGCGLTFDEFVNSGKFGCGNCYDTFEDKIDPILKNLHGYNRHIGRKGKVIEANKIQKSDIEKINISSKEIKKEDNIKENKINKLKADLKVAIKEERYEDAAKIRDEMKNMEEGEN